MQTSQPVTGADQRHIAARGAMASQVTIQPRGCAVEVQRLEDDDEQGLRALLLDDPVSNVFLLSYVESFGLSDHLWLGVRHGGHLRAAALHMPGRLTVPWSPAAGCATAIGEALRGLGAPTMMVGPREAVDALWAAWAPGAPTDRWYDQRLYTAERDAALPATAVGLRMAREDEESAIAALTADMEREDLGRDPLGAEPEAFLDTVRRRLRLGSTWVIERDGEIVFMIHTGARTPWGVQVGGTYVPPAWRGRGLGAAGMCAVTQELLRQFPRVTLHVNEANAAAVRTYERAGYRASTAFRLLTLPPAAPERRTTGAP